jgi:homoserine O-acetyltransferase
VSGQISDYYYKKKTLRLSSGLVINEHTIGFDSCGTLNDSATNAINACHAASANHHAARWYNVEKNRVGGIIT